MPAESPERRPGLRSRGVRLCAARSFAFIGSLRVLILECRPWGLRGSNLDQPPYLFVGEDCVALLGAIEYSLDAVRGGLDAVPAEPEYDVGSSAHRPDLDHLLAVQHSCRHAGIDHIGKPIIAFVESLDYRCRVNSGCCAKCVAAYNRIR